MDGFPNQIPPGNFPPGHLPPRGFHEGMRFYGERGGFEHHGGHHWFAYLLFALVLALLVLLVVAIVRGTFASHAVRAGANGASDDALSVLRLRYARGEIGRDDFLTAYGDLGGEPATLRPHSP